MEQTEIMAEHTSSSHAGQQGGGAFLVTTLTIRDPGAHSLRFL